MVALILLRRSKARQKGQYSRRRTVLAPSLNLQWTQPKTSTTIMVTYISTKMPALQTSHKKAQSRPSKTTCTTIKRPKITTLKRTLSWTRGMTSLQGPSIVRNYQAASLTESRSMSRRKVQKTSSSCASSKALRKARIVLTTCIVSQRIPLWSLGHKRRETHKWRAEAFSCMTIAAVLRDVPMTKAKSSTRCKVANAALRYSQSTRRGHVSLLRRQHSIETSIQVIAVISGHPRIAP